MLQRTALQADWTVETVIAMGRSPWGATADPAVLAAVMAVTGCDGLAGRRYPGLSGGEQQRVQLARCLAQLWRDGAPQGWLFLDEPTSALDLTISSTCCVCSNGSPPAGNCTSAWCCMTLTSPPCGPTASCCSTRPSGRPGTPQEVIQQPVIHRWYGADVRLVQHPDNAVPRFIWRHNPARRNWNPDRAALTLSGNNCLHYIIEGHLYLKSIPMA